jgi:hypothetical protein
MCEDKTIQELLPAYREQSLDPADSTRVEQHLASCEDCRTELALLRVIADDPLPVPNEAFWKALPETIYREVSSRRLGTKRRFALPELYWPHIPAWSFATAVVCLFALSSWFLLPPAFVDRDRTALTADEFSLSQEPVNLQQLSPEELDGATQWAKNQLAPIGEALSRDAAANRDNDLVDDLGELNDQELNAVYTLLKNKERERSGKLNRSS